ncbi:MAG TPA: hypothetical protein VF377_08805 [Acidimicrobiia bacterium]
MIIGLGHQKGVGKSTVARILDTKYGFQEVAFADGVKCMALDLFPDIRALVEHLGWDEAKKVPGVRERLQAIGNSARRWIDPMVWIRPVLEKVSQPGDWVIPDVRFRNEADMIRVVGGYIVKVERGEPNDDPDPSEQDLADWTGWDYVFDNNGSLGDLGRGIADMLDALNRT